jgi:hypothetical protein
VRLNAKNQQRALNEKDERLPEAPKSSTSVMAQQYRALPTFSTPSCRIFSDKAGFPARAVKK